MPISYGTSADKSARERLPNRRACETIAFERGGSRYQMTVGYFPDGRVGEIFLNADRGDSLLDVLASGCFVIEAAASAPHLAAGYSMADRTYLECLDAMTAQGRHVCHAPGRGYAPKAFAEMPQANGMTWKALQAAQERLFAAGMIDNVPYGPPSKGTKRVARKAST